MRNVMCWLGIACIMGVFWMVLLGAIFQSHAVALGALACAFFGTLLTGLFFNGASHNESRQ